MALKVTVVTRSSFCCWKVRSIVENLWELKKVRWWEMGRLSIQLWKEN